MKSFLKTAERHTFVNLCVLGFAREKLIVPFHEALRVFFADVQRITGPGVDGDNLFQESALTNAISALYTYVSWTDYSTPSEYAAQRLARAELLQELAYRKKLVIALAYEDDPDFIDLIRCVDRRYLLYFKTQACNKTFVDTPVLPGFHESPHVFNEKFWGAFLDVDDETIAFCGNPNTNHRYRDVGYLRDLCSRAGWKFRAAEEPWMMPLDEYLSFIGSAAAVICPHSWHQPTWRTYELAAMGGLALVQRVEYTWPDLCISDYEMFPTWIHDFELYDWLVKLHDKALRKQLRHRCHVLYEKYHSPSVAIAYYASKIEAWARYYGHQIYRIDHDSA